MKRINWLFWDYDFTLGLTEWVALKASFALIVAYILGRGKQFTMTEAEFLRTKAGRTFRDNLREACESADLTIDAEELERLVLEEEKAVIAALSNGLEPTDGANETLALLATTFSMLVVSSSAKRRLLACVERACQAQFFPPTHIFSAQTDLTPPTPKPNPAILYFVLSHFGIDSREAIGFEDSDSGVRCFVNAGVDVVSYVGAYPAEEHQARAKKHLELGAIAATNDFREIPAILAAIQGGDDLSQWRDRWLQAA